MNKFSTGLLIGGAAVVASAAYLSQNQRTKNRIIKKGKKAVVKAEEVIDDMMDTIQAR